MGLCSITPLGWRVVCSHPTDISDRDMYLETANGMWTRVRVCRLEPGGCGQQPSSATWPREKSRNKEDCTTERKIREADMRNEESVQTTG